MQTYVPTVVPTARKKGRKGHTKDEHAYIGDGVSIRKLNGNMRVTLGYEKSDQRVLRPLGKVFCFCSVFSHGIGNPRKTNCLRLDTMASIGQ